MMRVATLCTLAAFLAASSLAADVPATDAPAAGDITVTVAPDHPIPHVYVDGPVVVELLSPVDATCNVKVEVRGERTAVFELGQLELKAQEPYWRALEGLDAERGVFDACVEIEVQGQTETYTQRFCRIDRPLGPKTDLVGLNAHPIEEYTVRAVEAIPLAWVRFRADDPGFRQAAEEAVQAGLCVAAVLDPEEEQSPEAYLGAVLQDVPPDWVARWDLPADLAPTRLYALVETLRKRGYHAPVGLVADGPDALKQALEGGAGRFTSVLVFAHDAPRRPEIAEFRATAEGAGYESLPIVSVGRGVLDDEDHVPARIIRQVILNAAIGVARTELDAALVYSEQTFRPTYVCLSALAHRLQGAGAAVGAYAGELPFAPPVYAEVFRVGDAWCVVAWTTDEPRDISLDVAGASDIALRDLRNNELPPPDIAEDSLSLQVTQTPVYIVGRGGTLVLQAALSSIRKEAKMLLDTLDSEEEELPPFVGAMMEGLAKEEETGLDRAAFFSLLKLFPAIEQAWHEGGLAPALAVPCLAGTARIARTMCLVEQERGEPFVEPLPNILDLCSQLQTDYLAGSGGDEEGHARADWLLAEVGRLVEEANQAASSGRLIEASAVATLAEWRARALEHAARAAPLWTPPAPD